MLIIFDNEIAHIAIAPYSRDLDGEQAGVWIKNEDLDFVYQFGSRIFSRGERLGKEQIHDFHS